MKTKQNKQNQVNEKVKVSFWKGFFSVFDIFGIFIGERNFEHLLGEPFSGWEKDKANLKKDFNRVISFPQND